MNAKPKRVLFVAECVTLAHMARPAVLARTLAGTQYEVMFASDGRYDRLFPSLPSKCEHLFSISSERFLKALAKGKPLYDEDTLRRYVEDDLALFDRTKPDVVIGDFRLSLSVSARLAKIPYLTISNVYWSPYARQHYPVPELPITRALGVPLAQVLFSLVRPVVFALHTRPLNSVRRHFGLEPLGMDLRRTYTDADLVLYTDVPGLIKTTPLPANHRYIGPILWSPDVPTPSWWDKLDTSKPVIYLTPGSSGSVEQLPALAAALASLPASVMVATAGRILDPIDTPGVYAADFLPGEQAARRANVVVCNGGSPTTWQALAAGVPIVGIPSNLDQYLNIQALECAGVATTLRSEKANGRNLYAAIRPPLENPSYKQNAEELQQQIQTISSPVLFAQALRDGL